MSSRASVLDLFAQAAPADPRTTRPGNALCGEQAAERSLRTVLITGGSSLIVYGMFSSEAVRHLVEGHRSRACAALGMQRLEFRYVLFEQVETHRFHVGVEGPAPGCPGVAASSREASWSRLRERLWSTLLKTGMCECDPPGEVRSRGGSIPGGAAPRFAQVTSACGGTGADIPWLDVREPRLGFTEAAADAWFSDPADGLFGFGRTSPLGSSAGTSPRGGGSSWISPVVYHVASEELWDPFQVKCSGAVAGHTPRDPAAVVYAVCRKVYVTAARPRPVVIHFQRDEGIAGRIHNWLVERTRKRWTALGPETGAPRAEALDLRGPAVSYRVLVSDGVPLRSWLGAGGALALGVRGLQRRLAAAWGKLDQTKTAALDAVRDYCRWTLVPFASATGEPIDCSDDVLEEVARHLSSLKTAEYRARITVRHVAGLARRMSVFQAAKERGLLPERQGGARAGVISNDALVFARLNQITVAERRLLDRELSRLGGLIPTLYFVLDSIVAAKPRGVAREILPGSTEEEELFEWSAWLAGTFGVEIESGDSPGLDACMVRTRRSTAVCLGAHLDLGERTDAVFHELAHLRLEHEPNTSYGLDPARLAPERVRHFERQEREANAMSAVYRHVFTALTALVRRPRREVDIPARPGPGSLGGPRASRTRAAGGEVPPVAAPGASVSEGRDEAREEELVITHG